MSTDEVKNVQAEEPNPHLNLPITVADDLTTYANFCRMIGSPEELILDFAMNPQSIGVPTEPIQISQRIIMNYFTAKRFFRNLEKAIQRHEATFGPIETEIVRRVRPSVQTQAVPTAEK